MSHERPSNASCSSAGRTGAALLVSLSDGPAAPLAPTSKASPSATPVCGRLPLFSVGECPDARFRICIQESDKTGRLDTQVQLLPNSTRIRPLVAASLQQWVLALQSSELGHQVQHRVEFVLRGCLAISVLEGSTEAQQLAVSSVLQLPIAKCGSQCVTMPHLIVSLADKSESVGGECSIKKTKEGGTQSVNTWLLEPLRSPYDAATACSSADDGTQGGPSFEGAVVKHLNENLIAELRRIEQTQSLIPDSTNVSDVSSDVLLSLLGSGHSHAVLLAFMLANILAQKYDVTSVFRDTIMATWYSTRNNWFRGAYTCAEPLPARPLFVLVSMKLCPLDFCC